MRQSSRERMVGWLLRLLSRRCLPTEKFGFYLAPARFFLGSQRVDLGLEIDQALHVDLFLAEWALVLYLHPAFDAVAVKVVADVARQWSYVLFDFKIRHTDDALSLVVILLRIITNLWQRLDDHFT